LLVALGLSAAISACGDLGGRYRGSELVPPRTVDRRALERYPTGSPERTVLGWYRALQRGDDAAAGRYYTARPRGVVATPGGLRRLLAGMGPFVDRVGLGPISVDSVRPGSATVVTYLRVRWEAQNGRAEELRMPQAFTLTGTRGRWRFADTYFLRFARSFRPKKRWQDQDRLGYRAVWAGR
jgi:hypothetical protein